MPTESNTTTFAVLGLLTTDCRTGYDMKQLIDQSLNHFWKISYGQVYPTLKKLVDKELAQVVTISQNDKPDRKEYFITEKGKTALQSWISGDISALPSSKNELLLKLFFGRQQPAKQTIRQIQQHRTLLTERYNTYSGIEHMIKNSNHSSEDEPFWLLTLDHGKRVTQASIDWCNHAIKTIEQREE